MFLALFLLISHFTLTSNARTENDFKRPFGPRMCVHLCHQFGGCRCPIYVKANLTCLLFSVRNKTMVEEDICKFMVKGNKKISIRGRVIKIHGGRQVTIDTEVNESKDTGKPRAMKLNCHRKDMFDFHTFPGSKNLSCLVSSITKSYKEPNIIYMLLQCWRSKIKHDVLRFFDIERNSLLSNKIEFCLSSKGRLGFFSPCHGQRQIFLGPCVKENTRDCLYSVTLSSKQLYLTTYREPSTKARELVNDMHHVLRSFKPKSFLCSFYKTHDLLCIAGDKQLYQVDLNPDSTLIRLKQLKGYLYNFPGIKDFKIDKNAVNSRKSTGIITFGSAVQLVTLDFERKTIRKEFSTRTEAVTASVSNGAIFLHSQTFLEPFDKCNITYT